MSRPTTSASSCHRYVSGNAIAQTDEASRASWRIASGQAENDPEHEVRLLLPEGTVREGVP